MRKSERIFNFEMEEREGKVLLTTKEWPYSVLQVVPATPETFDEVVEKCRERGMVAKHDTDRTFVIIHLCSGDQNGLFPERHVDINSPSDAQRCIDALKDAMAQAAVFYYSNVILS